MKKKDGISFIITVYNKEKFINSTLESIKTNLSENSELIIIDDGSNDHSETKIKEFINKNKNIKTKFISQKNSGPSKAVNYAVAFAQYNFLKMLDGDDILAPGVATFMKKKMEEENFDLFYGHWVWSENHFDYKFKDKVTSASLFKKAFEKFLFSGWGGFSNLMIKTDVFLQVKGCDKNIFIQDYSLPLRVAGHHLKKKGNKKFKIGLTKKIICVGPKFVDERIITNKAQTLHDLSMASLNFIEEHPLLESKYKTKALKKIVRRYLKWDRGKKKDKKIDFNRTRLFLTYLSFLPNLQKIRYEILNVWKKEKDIRIIWKEEKKVKILIYVGLDLLGDGLIKLPFIKKVREVFPNAHITWLAGKGESVMNSLLKEVADNFISEIIDKEPFGSKLSDIFNKKYSNESYDIIFDTQKRFLTTIILKRLKTKLFISASCNFLFSDLQPSNKMEVNLTKSLLNLSFIFSRTERLNSLLIHNRNEFNSLIKKIMFSTEEKVAICPGASNTWKSWPLENYIEIGKYLISKKFLPVFFLGPNEISLINKLKKELPEAIYPLQSKYLKKPRPIHTILLAKHCKFGISNDTGCGHLLACSDLKLISLFGNTNPKKFAPYNTIFKNIIISAEPFSKKKDISSIPIGVVIKAINEIIN